MLENALFKGFVSFNVFWSLLSQFEYRNGIVNDPLMLVCAGASTKRREAMSPAHYSGAIRPIQSGPDRSVSRANCSEDV